MNRRFPMIALLAAGALLTFAPLAEARIKLITLPVRERVEIQLDHDQVTLVEEERIVPLVKGVNQVDFSWANTQIDPQTIVFRVLGPAEGKDIDVKVLSVSYPPNEAALVWQVSSSDGGAARVRISYLLGGLNKTFSYRAVADRDEKNLMLSQYLHLVNYANEEFGESGIWAGFGDKLLQTVGLNETKRVLMEKYTKIPVQKSYTADAAQFGYLDRSKDKLNVPMHYVLTNDKDHGLGLAALPYGKVRIFQEDSRGTEAFLGEDWSQFTPIDDESRLYLGLAQDVAVVRRIESNDRTRVAGRLYHQEVVVKFEVENFKDTPVTLDVAEHLQALRGEIGLPQGRDPEWVIGDKTTFKGGIDREFSDFDKLVFHADLPAAKDGKAEKVELRLHLIFRNEMN